MCHEPSGGPTLLHKRLNNLERPRTIFIKSGSMMDALTVVKKVRYAELKLLEEISSPEYIKGIQGQRPDRITTYADVLGAR